MKKLLFTLLTVASLSLVTACGGDNSSSQSTSSQSTSDSTTSEDSSQVITPGIDYTTNISCEAGSIEKELYTFTTLKPNDDSYLSSFDDPKIEITINQANWQHVTGYNTPIINIQNEEVVKYDALTFKETTVSDSNVINGFTLTLDRSKLNVGETQIKFAIKPSNGAQSAKILHLTFGLKVVEFGSIDPEIYDATVELDLSNLDSKYEGFEFEFVVYDNSHEYGYSFNKVTTSTIKEDKTVEIKLPKGHDLELSIRTIEYAPKWVDLTFTSDDSFEVNNNSLVFSKAPTTTLKAKVK